MHRTAMKQRLGNSYLVDQSRESGRQSSNGGLGEKNYCSSFGHGKKRSSTASNAVKGKSHIGGKNLEADNWGVGKKDQKENSRYWLRCGKFADGGGDAIGLSIWGTLIRNKDLALQFPERCSI